MAIFRRSRKGDPPDPPGEEQSLADDARESTDEGDDAAQAQSAEAGDTGEPARSSTPYSAFSRARGPFDVSEVESDDLLALLDLGSIRLRPQDGMQLRFELDETQQSVVSVHAVLGTSGVQLQAFAAPRSEGLWADIRDEIADSVRSGGGKASVVEGPFGGELRASMPSRAANGKTVLQDVRFLGVDGPRWFLRAVLSGTAVSDGKSAEPLLELVRSVVVVRDEQARPPREALPLQLPQAPEDASGAESEEGDAVRSADDLRPFERGPEITEVR